MPNRRPPAPPARRGAPRSSLGMPRCRGASFWPPWRGSRARTGAVANAQRGAETGRGRRRAAAGEAIRDAAPREVSEDFDRDIYITIGRTGDDGRRQIATLDDADRIE